VSTARHTEFVEKIRGLGLELLALRFFAVEEAKRIITEALLAISANTFLIRAVSVLELALIERSAYATPNGVDTQGSVFDL